MQRDRSPKKRKYEISLDEIKEKIVREPLTRTSEMVKRKEKSCLLIDKVLDEIEKDKKDKLSLKNLLSIYKKSFAPMAKKELSKMDPKDANRYAYGDVFTISTMQYVENFLASRIYAFVWTQTDQLGEHYHATSVIEFIGYSSEGYFPPLFMTISHQEKGSAIVTASEKFPYERIGGTSYYSYDGGSMSKGGIVCQGNCRPGIGINDVLHTVLAWWYIVDIKRESESFPGSCTGLTETMLRKFAESKVYESCINIRSTKSDQSRLNKPPYPLERKRFGFTKLKKSRRKSRRKSNRKPRKSRRKSRRKSNRKSGKSRRKSRCKSNRKPKKSRRKSRKSRRKSRKSRRKSNRKPRKFRRKSRKSRRKSRHKSRKSRRK